MGKVIEREPTIDMIRAAHDGPLGASDNRMQASCTEWLRDMFHAYWDASSSIGTTRTKALSISMASG